MKVRYKSPYVENDMMKMIHKTGAENFNVLADLAGEETLKIYRLVSD